MIMMKVDKSLLVGLLATVLGLTGAAIPLPEHPRPDWERPQWVNLNGEWDFGFEEGVYDRKILVPFAWGAPLSGVKDPDPRKAMTGRYRRFVTVPDAWRGKRVFVVGGAADHDTTCWFAGERLGGHSGGYTPFEFELTKFVRWGERQELRFDVWDGGNDPKWWMSHHLMGKQGYGNARGIWQTVYLEARGDDYLESVRFHPDVKRGRVRACLKLAEPVREARVATVAVAGQKAVEVPFAAGEREKSVGIALANPRLWTLDDPHLYDVTLKLGDDEVRSYFGLREIGTGFLPGTDFRYVTLNGKPVYLRMTLDQSHHPEGYCTLPSDEAMRNDILISKRLALTGNRIHLRVEQPRKLYWADKLGLLIQADVPCAYGPATAESFRESRACLEGMVGRDFNHPSIYQWTLYNETLGLFEDGGNDPKDRNARYLPWIRREVAESYRKAKALDPTRLVEDNSACNRDHVVTDVNSWHDYKPGYGWEALVRAWCDASFVGSTNNYIGGCRQGDVPMMNSECGNVWGYRGFTGDVDQSWDYHWMMNAFRRNPKCCGWLYTEHHDVINEWNGYVRYDRSPKYAGWEELFPGMTTADLHGEVYPVLDPAFFRTAVPGETWKMPVSFSVMGERWAGRTLSVRRECRWWDGCGRLHVTDGKDVVAFDCKAWQQGFLAEDAIALPSEPAAGVVAYSVRDGETVVGRNFAPFAVRRRDDDGRVVVAKSSWSKKSSAVLDGLKVNGMGRGFFELELDAPAEGGTFRAELSSRPLYAKDVEAGDANLSDTDIAFGGKGRLNPMSNANSYRMTSEECHASGLRIFANGKLVKETVLAGDPCDHRGLLSWMAQPQDFRLREAGTYGELVEARIPAEAVRNGKVTIRLEADDGLAIYGSRFGRYPLGPSVSDSGKRAKASCDAARRGTPDVVFENARCRLVLGADARAKSLVVKQTGEECLDGTVRVPFFSVTQERPFNNENKLKHPNRRTVYEATKVVREGDLLVVNFRQLRYAAEVEVATREDYFLFTLRGFRDLEKDYGALHVEHPPAVEMRLADLPVRQRTNFGEWLGVTWDDRAAVAVLGTSPDTFIGNVRAGEDALRLTADVRRGYRFKGGSAALVAAAGREPFLDCVDRFEADLDLPRGVANRRNPLVNASIFWAGDVCPTNVDTAICYAKRGGFKLMLVYYSAIVKEERTWRRSGEWAFRDEYPNGFEDLRKMLEKIRAAGIVPGLHFLQTHIGLDTAYVTPHADHRLGLRRHFTLSRPLDASGGDEVWVEEPTVDVPEHPGMRVLMFGGELMSYESATTEPPYRFRGVRRGALRTEAVSHRRGEIGGVLDLSEYGTPGSCYVSQDSSLQDEIADKIAAFWRCGFRFVYMDGSEGVQPPCDRNVARSQYCVWRKLEPRPFLGEAAAKSHFSWHMLSGANAFDVFPPTYFKNGTVAHPLAEAALMVQDLTRVNFGWWTVHTPDHIAKKKKLAPGSQADMWEFGTSKAAAWDCPVTVQCWLPDLAAHPRMNDLLDVVRRWEDVRERKWLTPAQKSLLKDPRRQFHLYQNGTGDYELHEIELLVPEAASGLRAFLFTRGDRRVIAYWHTSGEGDFELTLGPDGTPVKLHAADLRYLETTLTAEEVRRAFAAFRNAGTGAD